MAEKFSAGTKLFVLSSPSIVTVLPGIGGRDAWRRYGPLTGMWIEFATFTVGCGASQRETTRGLALSGTVRHNYPRKPERLDCAATHLPRILAASTLRERTGD